EIVKKETSMAEPTDYITAAQKNFITNNNEGGMIEKCIVEIQGAFLVKIRDYALMGILGKMCVTSEWFTKESIGSITTWDNMVKKFIRKFHHLSDHNKEEETEEDDNLNETDNRTARDGSSRKHYLFSRSQVLKSCFENFHELEYEVLVKLQECWWKVNAHENTPFTRMENFGRGPYANMKIEWASNPYLDINRTFGMDYDANNVGCTQENQGHKGNPIPKPSNCKVKRFEMMKYSFDDDKEYITIKGSEYLNHSKDNLNSYRELLRLINEGWVVTTSDDK
ncbi:hypothetical protein Tco_1022198, partial [Tanacetum coccineum]